MELIKKINIMVGYIRHCVFIQYSIPNNPDLFVYKAIRN